MTALACIPRAVSCLTSVDEVCGQRLFDIPEQDAEAEGVCHFVEESHGGMSFEGLHGADRAALVCSVYGSQHHAFRPLREVLGCPTAGNWPAGNIGIDISRGFGPSDLDGRALAWVDDEHSGEGT